MLDATHMYSPTQGTSQVTVNLTNACTSTNAIDIVYRLLYLKYINNSYYV